MRRDLLLPVVFAWAVALGGAPACSEDEPVVTADAEELRVEVFHTAASTVVDLRPAQRLAALPAELVQAPVDVVCLQGLGSPTDRAKLRAAVLASFPVSLELATGDDVKVDDPSDGAGFVPPAETKTPCQDTLSGIRAALTCLDANLCSTEPRGPLRSLDCPAAPACLDDALFDADPERRCRSCILSHARTGAPLGELYTRCTELVHPLAMRGQHGMMLLSRFPLVRPSLRVLPSEGTRRAVLGATVLTPRGAEVDVFCATLGPTQPSALPDDPRTTEPYPGPYGSPSDGWVRENEIQAAQLVTHVERVREGRPAIVLGNFGAGTAVVRGATTLVSGTGLAAASRLERAFRPAFAPGFVGGCTLCSDNPLGREGTPSFLNRIYLAGLPADAVRATTRSYVGAVVASDDRDVVQRLPLSPQYGFRAVVALPRLAR